jgi:hypothetical protein
MSQGIDPGINKLSEYINKHSYVLIGYRLENNNDDVGIAWDDNSNNAILTIMHYNFVIDFRFDNTNKSGYSQCPRNSVQKIKLAIHFNKVIGLRLTFYKFSVSQRFDQHGVLKQPVKKQASLSRILTVKSEWIFFQIPPANVSAVPPLGGRLIAGVSARTQQDAHGGVFLRPVSPRFGYISHAGIPPLLILNRPSVIILLPFDMFSRMNTPGDSHEASVITRILAHLSRFPSPSTAITTSALFPVPRPRFPPRSDPPR